MVRAGVSLKNVSILVILVVLVAVVVGAGPFALVLAGIWSLVAFCLEYTRKARKNATIAQSQVETNFRYNLCYFGVRHLIPIGIATAFYVLLSCYIHWFSDSLSIDSLIAMQHDFEHVSKSFSDHFKLNEVTIFAVFIAYYLLSCALLAKRRQGNEEMGATAGAGRWLQFRESLVATLHWTVDVYVKYSGQTAVCLATLASFTLFGMQLGEPTKDLQLRIKDVQMGYADVTKETEAKLSERVTTVLYAKIRDTFPPSYREALTLPTQIDRSVESVQQHADDVKSKYEVSVPPDVERTLQDEEARIKKVNELGSDLRIEGTGRQGVPGSTTHNQIEAAKNALHSRQEDKGTELIREGKKRVTLQAEKLGSEQIVLLTKPLTDAIPILEPPIKILAEAVDKILQEGIGKSYDRAMEAAMRNPRDLDAVVEREAKTIVDKTDIKTLVERATPRAQLQSAKLQQTLSSLEESKPLIDHYVTENLAARRSKQNCRDCPEILPSPDLHLPPDINRSPGMGNHDSPGRITSPRPLDPPRVPELRRQRILRRW